MVGIIFFAGWRVYDSSKDKDMSQPVAATKTEDKKEPDQQKRSGVPAGFGELKVAGMQSPIYYPLSQNPVKDVTSVDEGYGGTFQKETFVAKYQLKDVTLNVFKADGLVIQQGIGVPLTCAYDKVSKKFTLAPDNKYATAQSCNFKLTAFDGVRFLDNKNSYESVFIASYISPPVESNFLIEVSATHINECYGYGTETIPEAACNQKINDNQQKVDAFLKELVRGNTALFQ